MNPNENVCATLGLIDRLLDSAAEDGPFEFPSDTPCDRQEEQCAEFTMPMTEAFLV